MTSGADGVMTVEPEGAQWERLEFTASGLLKNAPLRAAYAIAQSLEYGDGRIEGGKILVAVTKPIIDRIGKLPTAFFDPTPDPSLLTIANEGGYHEIDAIVKQGVKLFYYPSQHWGHVAFGKYAKSGQREEAVRKYRAMRKLFPSDKMWNLFIKKAHNAIDPDGVDEMLGHWGLDHRAHDRWSLRDGVMAGGQGVPQYAWTAAWQTHRICALAAGADPDDFPAIPDGGIEVDERPLCDVGVPGVLVPSRHPSPKDPRISNFLRTLETNERVQGAGRGRYANMPAGEVRELHMFGGAATA